MIKNNTRLILILLGFLCAFGLFFGIRSYIQWKGNYYFGHVSSVSGRSFVLSGRGEREYVVDITDRTVIKRRIQTLVDTVGEGDRVMVIGKINDNNAHIEATLVRIMGYKKDSVTQP